MFYNASKFNSNINSWNVRSVTNFSEMFTYATSFNKPINKWNVENAINMEKMFFYALKFNQDISTWNISKVENMKLMFKETVFFSVENYDKLLAEWSKLPLKNKVTIDVDCKHCFFISHDILTNDFGWTINDFGKATKNDCNTKYKSNL